LAKQQTHGETTNAYPPGKKLSDENETLSEEDNIIEPGDDSSDSLEKEDVAGNKSSESTEEEEDQTATTAETLTHTTKGRGGNKQGVAWITASR
jgi:hypothetical protein